MKKAIPILALLLVSSFVVLNADDSESNTAATNAAAPSVDATAAADTPAPASVTPTDTCSGTFDADGKPVPTIANEFMARSVGHHQCPQERSCNWSGQNECTGDNACGINEATVVITDTGWSGCDTLSCEQIGQTIHIKEAYCKRCPCCTAQPHPCVCPNSDNLCGKVVEVYCE